MRNVAKVWLLLVLLVLAATPASAKLSFTPGQALDRWRYILVKGEFEATDDLSEFIALVNSHSPSAITFNSVGGNIAKAIELGRHIRRLQLHTIQFKGPECSSACAFAFMGGLNRFAEPGSIGVHRTSISEKYEGDTRSAVEGVQAITVKVMVYMREMGVDPELLEIALQYDSEDIRYLSGSEMQRYRVTYQSTDRSTNAQTAQPKLPAPSLGDSADSGNHSPTEETIDKSDPRRVYEYEFLDTIGEDIYIRRKIGQDACLQLCSRERNCIGITYDRWNRLCVLKSRFRWLRMDARAVSILYGIDNAKLVDKPIEIQRRRGKGFSDKEYTRMMTRSFEQCEQYCLDDEKCMGFNFIEARSACLLIEKPSEYNDMRGVDVGIKRQQP